MQGFRLDEDKKDLLNLWKNQRIVGMPLLNRLKKRMKAQECKRMNANK